MIYYTKDGKRVSYNCDTENPMKGKQGVVYRLLDDSSKCLKEYLPDNQVEPMYRNYNRHFDCEMFEMRRSVSFGVTPLSLKRKLAGLAKVKDYFG